MVARGMSVQLFGSLLAVIFCVGSVSGQGRGIQVHAYDYVVKYGVLQIGQCAKRASFVNKQGERVEVRCDENLRYNGTVREHHQPLSEFSADRLTSAADSYTMTMGAGGVGVSVMGLVGAMVKVTVTKKTWKKSNTLTLTERFRYRKGMLTFETQWPQAPAVPDDTNVPYYLSDIILGAEEMLIVQLEFESERVKTEVEVELKIKILFISISVKMRFVFKKFKSAAKVKIFRYSTFPRGTHDEVFSSSQFEAAIARVEHYENQFKRLPDRIRNSAKNSDLHLEYYFSPWTETPVTVMQTARDTNLLEELRRQLSELEYTHAELTQVINQVGDINKRTQLASLQQDIHSKKIRLRRRMTDYFMLSYPERTGLKNIYGVHKVPGYYQRLMDRLLSETNLAITY